MEPSEGICREIWDFWTTGATLLKVRNQNKKLTFLCIPDSFRHLKKNIPSLGGWGLGWDGGTHLVRWRIPSILWQNGKRKQQQRLTQIFLSEQGQINCDPSHDPRIKRSRDAVTDFDFVSSGVDRCFSIHLSFLQFRCQFWSIQSTGVLIDF